MTRPQFCGANDENRQTPAIIHWTKLKLKCSTSLANIDRACCLPEEAVAEAEGAVLEAAVAAAASGAAADEGKKAKKIIVAPERSWRSRDKLKPLHYT
jgi:hypothetical protein